jgi:type IV fimbrial biogenesis protein FimT
MKNMRLLIPQTTRRPSGFTLLELLVIVVMIAILMMVGVPSFLSFQRNSELTSSTNTLLGALNVAKSEAIKRGMRAVVVPNDGSDWRQGWVVFVDKDRTLDPTTTENRKLIIQQRNAADPLPSYFTFTWSGTNNPSFDASGFALESAGTFSIVRNDVSDDEKSQQTRRIQIAKTGHVRSCKPVSSSDPLCAPS